MLRLARVLLVNLYLLLSISGTSLGFAVTGRRGTTTQTLSRGSTSLVGRSLLFRPQFEQTQQQRHHHGQTQTPQTTRGRCTSSMLNMYSLPPPSGGGGGGGIRDI